MVRSYSSSSLQTRHLGEFGHQARHGVRGVHDAKRQIEQAAAHLADTLGLLVFDPGMGRQILDKMPDRLDKRDGAHAVDAEEIPARLGNVLVQTSLTKPERILRLLAGRTDPTNSPPTVRRENRPEPTGSPLHREGTRSNSIAHDDKTGPHPDPFRTSRDPTPPGSPGKTGTPSVQF